MAPFRTLVFALVGSCGPAPIQPVDWLHKDVPVVFAKLGGNMIGSCHATEFTRWIQIDPDFWERATKSEQEMLMLHERGHCQYGLEHDPAERKDGCAVSLMHPIIPSLLCIKKHKAQYLLDFEGRKLNVLMEDLDARYRPYQGI